MFGDKLPIIEVVLIEYIGETCVLEYGGETCVLEYGGETCVLGDRIQRRDDIGDRAADRADCVFEELTSQRGCEEGEGCVRPRPAGGGGGRHPSPWRWGTHHSKMGGGGGRHPSPWRWRTHYSKTGTYPAGK